MSFVHLNKPVTSERLVKIVFGWMTSVYADDKIIFEQNISHWGMLKITAKFWKKFWRILTATKLKERHLDGSHLFWPYYIKTL